MKFFLMRIILILLISGSLHAGTIHGFVREKTTREPVIMANVWIRDTQIGVATNLKGYYVLSALPPGEYELVVSFIGYRTVRKSFMIGADEDIEIDIELESEAILIGGAEIVAERDKRELDIKPGQILVQASQIRTIPAVAEADLFRGLQMLPGVATLSDFSAGLYIRGGSPDQNLILLDGIDVYNPNHLFGFFSTFNTDAVKSVELLKGGFPAKYGGRLSSVLNVVNKEGNREEFQGVARLGLLSASATLEGPWKRGSWMVSGRRTYLDLAARLADFNLPYYFYDGHAKINFDIDRKNQASLSFYLGNDMLDLKQDGTSIGLDWGNKTFSAQWTHLFSTTLFSHFLLAGSRFTSDTRVQFDRVRFGILNRITDFALKGILTYSPSSWHSIEVGFEGKNLNFNLDYTIVDTDYRNTFSGAYGSLFIQDNLKIAGLTLFQTGLRLEHYSDGAYIRIAPRFSVKQILTDRFDLTASWGRYHQYLNLVQMEGMNFADMWFPVDRTFDPGAADHFVFGVSYDDKSVFSIDAEVYLKNYGNIAEYRRFRRADESLDEQTAAQNFLSGTGKAYGGDIYLRNRLGRFEGWLGYSLTWTTKKIAGFNFGDTYHPNYDRRHTVTAIQDFHVNRRWRINLAFKYGSGQPYTEAAARYTVMDPLGRFYDEVLMDAMNNYRLPSYHRLDLGVFYRTTLFRMPTEIHIQAINAYNQDNVWFRKWDTTRNPTTVTDVTMLPFIPTAGISIKF
ncbi:MAG TPA: TonB-dependent receptor [bacterium]|nr:TonB-dependent receptor [bacterium]